MGGLTTRSIRFQLFRWHFPTKFFGFKSSLCQQRSRMNGFYGRWNLGKNHVNSFIYGQSVAVKQVSIPRQMSTIFVDVHLIRFEVVELFTNGCFIFGGQSEQRNKYFTISWSTNWIVTEKQKSLTLSMACLLSCHTQSTEWLQCNRWIL